MLLHDNDVNVSWTVYINKTCSDDFYHRPSYEELTNCVTCVKRLFDYFTLPYKQMSHASPEQEAQLSPSDRAMRLVSSNLANYHATVQNTYTTSPDQTDGMKLEV